MPDLRFTSKETLQGIADIVLGGLGGTRASTGMPSFDPECRTGAGNSSLHCFASPRIGKDGGGT
jgi:hypothetical protein